MTDEPIEITVTTKTLLSRFANLALAGLCCGLVAGLTLDTIRPDQSLLTHVVVQWPSAFFGMIAYALWHDRRRKPKGPSRLERKAIERGQCPDCFSNNVKEADRCHLPPVRGAVYGHGKAKPFPPPPANRTKPLDTTGKPPPTPWAYGEPKCGAPHSLGQTVLGPSTTIRCQWPAGHVGPHGIDSFSCTSWDQQ